MTEPYPNLKPDELTELTRPYYNQLEKQGELRDNEVIGDKALEKLQRAILSDANLAVTFRLKQEQYRRLWQYQDQLRLDKWARKDKRKAMKRARRAHVQAARKVRRDQKAAARKIGRKPFAPLMRKPRPK